MRSGSNLRSSDHFRFSAADLGGLDTHAGDRSGAVGNGDHVAGLVLELVGKHCIAVESGGFGHILAIGEPDFVLALPLPMAAMRRASLRMRPLRLRPSKLCACPCFSFLQSALYCAISTLGFVNQLPRRFRRTKRELSSSQSEYLSQTLFPSTVIPNIPSRLNHDSCFCCMMCKRSGGGAASQAEVRQVRRRLGRYERSGWLSRPQTWTAPAARTDSRRT